MSHGTHPRLALIFGLIAVLLPAVPALGGEKELPIQTAAAAPATASDTTHERSATVLSDVYTIDKKYRSMMGPYSMQQVELLESEEPELLWITGFQARMVGPDGETPELQEFMCHSNLDIDTAAHRQALGVSPSFSSRLFTLSQGQFTIDFPEGFGIPVMSDQALNLTTQVLNHNLENAKKQVRHKVTLDFVRDRDREEPMKALFPVGAYGLALLEGDSGHFGVGEPDEEKHGPGCLPGDNASNHTYNDPMGRVFTGHWVVPPGRQVNRTLVTRLMRVPYDTRIHYIAVHLHPFAESLELKDLTTGETLFKSDVENFEDRIGLARVQELSSPEGIPVYSSHDYELVSVYNNTSEEPQDSMAVMYIYLRDLQVERGLEARRQREKLEKEKAAEQAAVGR